MEEDLKFPDDYMSIDSMDILSQYNHINTDIRKAYELGNQFEFSKLPENVDHIFCIGMGGSSISFQFLKSYLLFKGINKPITIIQDYTLPNTLTKNSLVFVASYSGNTEETLTSYKSAHRITENIFAVSSGGKLEELSRLNKNPFVLLPPGYQPRTAAISFMFFPFLKLLERLHIVENVAPSVESIVSTLSKPKFKELAISISEKLIDKIPIIYSSTLMYPVAYRFKTQINENAKTHAFSHKYSEMNHNEILGYMNLKAQYHIITFRFNDDHRRIQKRMDIVKELTNSKGVATTEIALSGEDFLTKMMSAVLIGDLTSIYLALRYKIDPSPIEPIEDLKKKLGTIIF